jgi:YHS domain-containing protein
MTKEKVKCDECNKSIDKQDSKEYKDNYRGAEYTFCSVKCCIAYIS